MMADSSSFNSTISEHLRASTTSLISSVIAFTFLKPAIADKGTHPCSFINDLR
uniref:Uncharacterized protein n=1 Tax=Arcella intermedia TaxID=1963864 RepID=A0A6B2LY24_9EUKA